MRATSDWTTTAAQLSRRVGRVSKVGETVRNYVFVGRKMEDRSIPWCSCCHDVLLEATSCSTGCWPAGIRWRRSAAAS